jgi:hypothetical protein
MNIETFVIQERKYSRTVLRKQRYNCIPGTQIELNFRDTFELCFRKTDNLFKEQR